MLISRWLFRASNWTIYRPVWGLLSDTRQGLPVPLHSVAPFVEIPDLLYAPGIVLDANRLEAVNAGARCGVMGQDIMTKGYG